MAEESRTIKISKKSADELINRKVHPRETYDDVIQRLLLIEKVTEDYRSHKTIPPVVIEADEKTTEELKRWKQQ